MDGWIAGKPLHPTITTRVSQGCSKHALCWVAFSLIFSTFQFEDEFLLSTLGGLEPYERGKIHGFQIKKTKKTGRMVDMWRVAIPKGTDVYWLFGNPWVSFLNGTQSCANLHREARKTIRPVAESMAKSKRNKTDQQRMPVQKFLSPSREFTMLEGNLNPNWVKEILHNISHKRRAFGSLISGGPIFCLLKPHRKDDAVPLMHHLHTKF